MTWEELNLPAAVPRNWQEVTFFLTSLRGHPWYGPPGLFSYYCYFFRPESMSEYEFLHILFLTPNVDPSRLN